MLFTQDSLSLKLKPGHENSAAIKNLPRDKHKTDFDFQFSFGPGVQYVRNFDGKIWVFGFDLGFKTSDNFILVPGADLLYDVDDHLNDMTPQLSANLYLAPSLFFQTRALKLYFGIGAAYNIPNILISIIFLQARVGLKTSEITSIDLSFKLHKYLFDDPIIEIPIVTLLYTIQF